jgi:hypothetical protein
MIQMKIIELFFDKAKILTATDKAAKNVLSKFGAYVRQAARSSIRSRKKSSQAGQPPSSHVGTLKRLIFFAFEPPKNVVIGPIEFDGRFEGAEALEYGGKSTIKTISKTGHKTKSITIQARPFMGPAMEKEKPKLPGMWADSIK